MWWVPCDSINEAAVVVVEDLRAVSVGSHFAIESAQIKPDLLRIMAQVAVFQLVRMSVEKVMHLPREGLISCPVTRKHTASSAPLHRSLHI
jgi:hypothetical protein